MLKPLSPIFQLYHPNYRTQSRIKCTLPRIQYILPRIRYTLPSTEIELASLVLMYTDCNSSKTAKQDIVFTNRQFTYIRLWFQNHTFYRIYFKLYGFIRVISLTTGMRSNKSTTQENDFGYNLTSCYHFKISNRLCG
jgi:hypothetical protein